MHTSTTTNTPSIAAANAATSSTRKSNSIFALDDLIALRTAHDAWFNGAYKASNDELYRLLAKCHDIYQRMTGNRVQIAAFAAECATRGLNFKKTTSLIYRIVKYVFGIDSKRASRYAIVLTIAHAEHVDPMDLHTWIASYGGIEEIQAQNSGRISTAARKKANKDTGTTAAQTASAVQTYDVPGFSIKDAASPFVAVLARVNDAGIIELIAPIADAHAVDVVLTAYGATVSASTIAAQQVATINAQNAATVAALNS